MERSGEDRSADLYDEDFYSWTQTQAALLRAGRTERADLVNIAEEIETLGRSELSTLRSAYRLVAMHLLKLRFQPTHATPSWRSTIVRERGVIEDVLHDNPGLRPRRSETLTRAYPAARREAASETQLPLETFPRGCVFSLHEIESHDFWPEAVRPDIV